jgi:hypothetical protein
MENVSPARKGSHYPEPPLLIDGRWEAGKGSPSGISDVVRIHRECRPEMEFAPQGTLAESIGAGGPVLGLGGAIDLLVGARTVVTTTTHIAEDG